MRPEETTETDVCIVGSGPAGLTIARELSGTGARILILESGGREHNKWSDALNEIESVGSPRVMDQTLLRNRVFGGSSSTWSGRVASFDSMDFTRRDWVPNSGWPITREEFSQYLPRTQQYLGIHVEDNNNTEILWELVGGESRKPAHSDRLFIDYFWPYSRDFRKPQNGIHFGSRALKDDMPGVRSFLNATVVNIDVDPVSNVATGVQIMGPDGRYRFVRTKLTVLCAGAIENARLLLASNRIFSNGVGNQNGVVGRYLMDHLRGPIGHFDALDYKQIQRIYGDYKVKFSKTSTMRVKYGAALSPVVQRAESLLNCAVWVEGSRASEDPWNSAKQLIRGRGNHKQNVINIINSSGIIAESLKRNLVDGRSLLMRLDQAALHCIVEQIPNPDSRVLLSERTDAFGVPLSRIDWRINEQEARTVRRCGELFVTEMRRLRLPIPKLTEMMTDSTAAFFLPDVAHPTGTTRMSSDPKLGVVDINCAVHGIAGLFIAGSSIFPTSGHANPTQTIVALAVRLADYLKKTLNGESGKINPQSDTAIKKFLNRVDARRSSEKRPLVLVTGARGKLGSRLTPMLLERGYDVRALTSRMRPNTEDGIDWRSHDLRQSDLDFSEDVEDCQAVLHLGAELQNSADMIRTNAEATGALAYAAEAEGVSFMCYTSTISVYGSAKKAVVSEASPVLTPESDIPSEYWANDHMRSYGRTKLQGERAIHTAAKNVEYVIFRPTVIVDLDDIREIVQWGAIRKSLLARHNAHHIYVLDAAEAIIWAMERALGRDQPNPGVTTYNLSNDDISENKFGKILDRLQKNAGDNPSDFFLALPSAIKWVLDYARYGNQLSLRRPIGLTVYSPNKLYADGYKHRHGIKKAWLEAMK